MGANPEKSTPARDREAHLAAALRENLRKRKRQAMARAQQIAENEKQK